MNDEAVPSVATHYFVLGTCGWFEALSPDMASVEVAVDALPAASTSITYPDRVVAMRCGAAYGLPEGSADDEYGGYEFREFEKFVEVQVWTDDVLDLVAPAA